jgi:hypothetical protein
VPLPEDRTLHITNSVKTTNPAILKSFNEKMKNSSHFTFALPVLLESVITKWLPFIVLNGSGNITRRCTCNKSKY